VSDSNIHTSESLLDEIVMVYDNLIFERSGDTWAFFELATNTYDMLARQTKKEQHGRLISAIGRLPAPGRGKIIITRQDFDRDQYMADLRAVNPTSREYQKWLYSVDNTLTTDRGSKRKVYLAVRLHQDIFPKLSRSAREVYKSALAFFRMRVLGLPTPIPDYEVARSKILASHVEMIFKPMLAHPGDEVAPQRPGPIEAARLIRHLYQRGMPHDDIPAMGTLWENHEDSRVLIPNPQAWRALAADTAIRNQYSQLALYHGNGAVTFQRFLGLSGMPTRGLAFPGDEYAYPKHAADILLDFDLTPYYEAERKREGKEQRLSAQEEHILGAGGKIDMGMADARAAHREMEATFRAGMPRVGLHASYCVTADTVKDLDQKTEDLKDEMKGMRITLAEARGMHLQAFADYIPAGSRRLRSYLVPMPPVTLAGAMPIATDHVGDDRGPYLGLTHRTAAPVCFDATRAMQINKNGSVAFIGSQGSGKSVTMYTMFAQLCLAGYWQILLDPKGDAKKISNLSELSGSLHEVFIEPGSEIALPILKLFPLSEIDKTWRVLRDFLIQLFGAQEGQTELQQDKSDATRAATHLFMKWFEESEGTLSIHRLKDAFYEVGRQERTGNMANVANRLAYLLETFSENELSSIVLSDAGDVFGATAGGGIATGDPRSIIFYTHKLRLQNATDRANGMPPTEEERMAQSVMSVVAAAAYELAGKQRFTEKTFRGVHVDEAWQIRTNSTGKSLTNFLQREARSQFVGSFFASQKWADVEDMKDHLGAIFLGRNPSEEDVTRALTYMGVTPDEHTVSMVQGYGSGNFVFKDIDDQVAPMYVQPTPDRWRQLLDTSPGNSRRARARQAEPIGA